MASQLQEPGGATRQAATRRVGGLEDDRTLGGDEGEGGLQLKGD